jgi:CubicO group peptidase (beta-lactamase class C family)
VLRGTKRTFVATASIGLLALGVSGAAFSHRDASATPAAATPAAAKGDQAAAIVAIARDAMKTDHLNAVIVRVTVDGKPVVTRALGNSMTGVPATTAMHFRNGAVAISYVSTLLMIYVDQHKVSLDDTVAKWFPDLPEADTVSLKMLANMTSGYPDYVTNPDFTTALLADPFRNVTTTEQLEYAFARPVSFPPGTNWGYAHTNVVVLGQILEKVGGKPLATLLRKNVLSPLGLTNTVASQTAALPEPALHAFDSERRTELGIPATTPFYEESTYWNPSWTLAAGSVQTTDIVDMTRTAEGIGGGSLLSKSSYEAQTGPNLLGFGSKLPGCACGPQTEAYNYGLGIVRSGSWLLQNPLFAGSAATEADLPSQKIAIAVAVTFGPDAFDAEGNYANASDGIFRAIGALMAPDDAPPVKQ